MSTSPSQWMTIGDFLLRRLEEAGVGHLFGVPGDYNLELLQQLEDTGQPHKAADWPVWRAEKAEHRR
jgi:TPP-dependent 2-oxoacid decarboxylase